MPLRSSISQQPAFLAMPQLPPRSSSGVAAKAEAPPQLPPRSASDFGDGDDDWLDEPNFMGQSGGGGGGAAAPAVPERVPMVHRMEVSAAKMKYDESKMIGQGQFTNIYMGEVYGFPAAIKVLKSSEAQGSGNETMTKETETMKKLLACGQHNNIVQLLGYSECREIGETPMLAVELAMHGTMLRFCETVKSRKTEAGIALPAMPEQMWAAHV